MLLQTLHVSSVCFFLHFLFPSFGPQMPHVISGAWQRLLTDQQIHPTFLLGIQRGSASQPPSQLGCVLGNEFQPMAWQVCVSCPLRICWTLQGRAALCGRWPNQGPQNNSVKQNPTCTGVRGPRTHTRTRLSTVRSDIQALGVWSCFWLRSRAYLSQSSVHGGTFLPTHVPVHVTVQAALQTALTISLGPKARKTPLSLQAGRHPPLGKLLASSPSLWRAELRGGQRRALVESSPCV